MLIDMTAKEFVEELASSSPAPGGGSVAALSGAMGAGLLHMVLNLTLGREKFAAAEAELSPLKPETQGLYRRLLNLVDDDTEAFNAVMAAFKLPKDSDEDKQVRSAAIQHSYKQAADIPLEVAACCVDVLKLCPVIVRKGNPNSASDAGVAAQVAYAGLEGAVMNVKINLGSIKDSAYVATAGEKIAVMLQQGREWKEQALAALAETL